MSDETGNLAAPSAHTAENDAPCRKGDRSQERHVRARKDHRCEWCGKPIPKGSDHVVATEFPGGDAGYADAAGHPVRMRIHGEPPCHYHGETRVTSPASPYGFGLLHSASEDADLTPITGGIDPDVECVIPPAEKGNADA